MKLTARPGFKLSEQGAPLALERLKCVHGGGRDLEAGQYLWVGLPVMPEGLQFRNRSKQPAKLPQPPQGLGQ